MAHEQSARPAQPAADASADLSDLLAALAAGDGVDLIRRVVQRGLQALIDAEATGIIGAERHERTDTRVNHRNGARERLLTTPAGDVELRVPKLRRGSFFPSLLEPRRRVDRALWAVVMQAMTSRGVVEVRV